MSCYVAGEGRGDGLVIVLLAVCDCSILWRNSSVLYRCAAQWCAVGVYARDTARHCLWSMDIRPSVVGYKLNLIDTLMEWWPPRDGQLIDLGIRHRARPPTPRARGCVSRPRLPRHTHCPARAAGATAASALARIILPLPKKSFLNDTYMRMPRDVCARLTDRRRYVVFTTNSV